MKFPRLNRRRFLATLALGLPAAAVADSCWVEPTWLKVRKIRLNKNPAHRLVHCTDLHHKGDRNYLAAVVRAINKLQPDFVCVTGDLVEDNYFLQEALEILGDIKAPIYGSPGNHDYWSRADFGKIAEAFAHTGGAWLVHQQAATRDGKITLHGAGEKLPLRFEPNPATKNIALMHYPLWADRLGGKQFDLLLAGHSHGGQMRIPFYGPIILPYNTGKYDLGLFATAAGPLYVSSGVGWFYLPLRFRCRPEIVLFEI